MKLNQAGIDLVKKFEGCKLEVYKDLRGFATVGYGHRTFLDMRHCISQDEADQLLASDLQKTADALSEMITLDLNDNQFSACVCLAFNIGVNAFKDSTLLKLLNGGGVSPASEQFERWAHAGDIIIQGLLRRRLAEKALFLQP
jgi:lysozyme